MLESVGDIAGVSQMKSGKATSPAPAHRRPQTWMLSVRARSAHSPHIALGDAVRRGPALVNDARGPRARPSACEHKVRGAKGISFVLWIPEIKQIHMRCPQFGKMY